MTSELAQFVWPEIDQGLLVVPIVFFVGGVIAVAAIVAPQWRKVRQAQYDARLKQLMIERGMSADEIERVIRASNVPADTESEFTRHDDAQRRPTCGR